jgi:hypothetical protein
MSRKVNWTNYLAFVETVAVVRDALREFFGDDVRLLDAHSFLWMLPKVVQFADAIAAAETGVNPLQGTDGLAWATYRRGQAEFRKQVVNRFGSMCAVTGITDLNLLEAAHIKPWKHSDRLERIDPNNGLLLAFHVHTLFDKGYITFADNGSIVFSPKFERETSSRLGISADLKLAETSEETLNYLPWHRGNVFKANNLDKVMPALVRANKPELAKPMTLAKSCENCNMTPSSSGQCDCD